MLVALALAAVQRGRRQRRRRSLRTLPLAVAFAGRRRGLGKRTGAALLVAIALPALVAPGTVAVAFLLPLAARRRRTLLPLVLGPQGQGQNDGHQGRQQHPHRHVAPPQVVALRPADRDREEDYCGGITRRNSISGGARGRTSGRPCWFRRCPGCRTSLCARR